RFTDPPATHLSTLSLHDALPISYDLALFDVESADRQRRAFAMLGYGDRADGLLIVSLVPPPEELARLEAAHVPCILVDAPSSVRSEEHTSELQSRFDLVCRLLLE